MLLYWSGIYALGDSSVSRFCARLMWLSGSWEAASVGVLTILAPNAFIKFAYQINNQNTVLTCSTFSSDIFSGRVIITGYPLMAAAKQRPTPVFPEVGSMIVVATGVLRNLPSFSAYSIIRCAILSL